MAAVTVVKRRTAISGNRKHKTFTITGGSGDTLDTRLKTIEAAAVMGGTNSPTILAESTVNGYQTLTFTSGGAFTAIKIIVIGN